MIWNGCCCASWAPYPEASNNDSFWPGVRFLRTKSHVPDNCGYLLVYRGRTLARTGAEPFRHKTKQVQLQEPICSLSGSFSVPPVQGCWPLSDFVRKKRTPGLWAHHPGERLSWAEARHLVECYAWAQDASARWSGRRGESCALGGWCGRVQKGPGTSGAALKQAYVQTTEGRVQQSQRDAAQERKGWPCPALHQKAPKNRYRFLSAPILHETSTTSHQEYHGSLGILAAGAAIPHSAPELVHPSCAACEQTEDGGCGCRRIRERDLVSRDKP